MALVRDLIRSTHNPGYKTSTDLKWSVSDANGHTQFHIFSDGSENRENPKTSQVYTFNAKQALHLAELISEHFASRPGGK